MDTTTLPSGRVITQCCDKAGRVKSVAGLKTGESSRTYLNVSSYDSGGGVNQAQLGSVKWEDWYYNDRKQPTQLKVGNTAGGSELMALAFGYGPTANNNGNVWSQTIVRGANTWTQSYGMTRWGS